MQAVLAGTPSRMAMNGIDAARSQVRAAHQ